MSKLKSNSTKKCSKSCCDSSYQSWVFIMKEFTDDTANDSNEASFIQLRHPRTQSASLFLFSPGNKTVQEVLQFNDKPRTFFVGNQIKSDGKVFISSPIDPLYLALPYLKNYERCSPLDHIIVDDEFPETERLLDCTGMKYIHHIADKKGDDSLNAYIYNEEKTLKWLEKKVRKLASALKEKGIHVASNSVVSANFVMVKESEDADSYLRYACGVVSNYLPDSISTLLESHLNLPPLDSDKKRKSSTIENGVDHCFKKQKFADDGYSEESPSPAAKEKKATPSAKEKKMAKAASGTKSITSFFRKK